MKREQINEQGADMTTKTQTFAMHLYMDTDDKKFVLDRWKREGEHSLSWQTYVGPVEVQAEVPLQFDLRAAQLADKQKELTAVRAEFTKRITALQRQINELQAIEMAEVA